MKYFIIADDQEDIRNSLRLLYEPSLHSLGYGLACVDLTRDAAVKAYTDLSHKEHNVIGFIVDIVGPGDSDATPPHYMGREVIAALRNAGLGPVIAYSHCKGKSKEVDYLVNNLKPSRYVSFEELRRLLRTPNILEQYLVPSNNAAGTHLKYTDHPLLLAQVDVIGGDTASELIARCCPHLDRNTIVVQHMRSGYSGALLFHVTGRPQVDMANINYAVKLTEKGNTLQQELDNFEAVRSKGLRKHVYPDLVRVDKRPVEVNGWHGLAYEHLNGVALDALVGSRGVNVRDTIKLLKRLFKIELRGHFYPETPTNERSANFWESHCKPRDGQGRIHRSLAEMRGIAASLRIASEQDCDRLRSAVDHGELSGVRFDETPVSVPIHAVHGDLHPGNIVVGERNNRGEIKYDQIALIDFSDYKEKAYGLADYATLESHLWIAGLGRIDGGEWRTENSAEWVNAFAQSVGATSLAVRAITLEIPSTSEMVIDLVAAVRHMACSHAKETDVRAYLLCLLGKFIASLSYIELRDSKRLFCLGAAAHILNCIAKIERRT